MFTPNTKRIGASVFFVAILSTAAIAQSAPQHYGFGSKVESAELAKYFAIPADGSGLPPGNGTAAAGAKVYADTCAACHGDKLQGNPAKGIGGDRLLGGRGSLATKTPIKTVESYWPYATTLFDYVKRAMPFSAPGSMKDDDVYAVVAYILSEAKVIKPTDAMPNKDGFIPDSRPELSLYR